MSLFSAYLLFFVIWSVEVDLFVGCVGSCWTDCAEGSGSPRGRDAIFFIQGCGTVFLSRCAVSVSHRFS